MTFGPYKVLSLDVLLKISPQLPSCTSVWPAPAAPKHYKSLSNIRFRVFARRDWLVFLKTADSHGVFGFVVILMG
jgi:hypothetical protein